MIARRRDAVILAVILLAACAVRVAAVLALPEQNLPDAQTYRTAAQELLNGELIVSHLVMPLYSLVIAAFGGGRLGQIVVDILASTATAGLLWALTRRLFDDVAAAHLAALVFAVYPLSVFYAATGLSEGFFAALVVGAFLALYTGRTLTASILFVLSILTRPTLDLFAPVVLVWTALVVRRQGPLRALRDLTVYALVYALLLAPWWAHNMAKYDQFVRLNLGMGVTLYTGNNPLNHTGGGIGNIDVNLRPFQQIPDPVARDRAFTEAAITFMKEEPIRAAHLAWLKFQRFWSFLPVAEEYRGNPGAIITALALLPVLALALWTLAAEWRRFWYFTPILGLIAYLTLVHMVTIGSIRYRFPLEPFLIVFAAPALAALGGRLPGGARLLAWLRGPEGKAA